MTNARAIEYIPIRLTHPTLIANHQCNDHARILGIRQGMLQTSSQDIPRASNVSSETGYERIVQSLYAGTYITRGTDTFGE